MSARWVICPVIEETVNGKTYRRPKVSTIVDPGRAAVPITTFPDATRSDPGAPVIVNVAKTYGFSAAISDGQSGQENTWCLGIAVGVDMSALDADPTIESLIEADGDASDLEGFLLLTMDGLNLSPNVQNRVKKRLSDRGVSTSDIDGATTVGEIIRRLGEVLQPGFDPKRAKTKIAGA